MVLMDFKPHNTEKVLPSQIIQVTGAAFGMYLGSVNLARINNQTDQTARSYGLCKPNGDGTYKILYWVDEGRCCLAMVTPLMYLTLIATIKNIYCTQPTTPHEGMIQNS